tara:strand:+ start:793 stop:1200 length:408 start_codon:yes stop_codon:yes gene_type:complete
MVSLMSGIDRSPADYEALLSLCKHLYRVNGQGKKDRSAGEQRGNASDDVEGDVIMEAPLQGKAKKMKAAQSKKRRQEANQKKKPGKDNRKEEDVVHMMEEEEEQEGDLLEYVQRVISAAYALQLFCRNIPGWHEE